MNDDTNTKTYRLLNTRCMVKNKNKEYVVGYENLMKLAKKVGYTDVCKVQSQGNGLTGYLGTRRFQRNFEGCFAEEITEEEAKSLKIMNEEPQSRKCSEEQVRIAAIKEFDAIRDAGKDCNLDSGVYKAYNACEDTEYLQYRIGDTEIVMEDFCWEDERKKFIKTLRKLGVKSMVVTMSSIDEMHEYTELGCRLIGLCKISHWDCFSKQTVEKKGIRFEL